MSFRQLLPTEKGVYAVEFYLPQDQYIQIGRLGAATFPAGSYLYLGSAQGAGGVRSRLGRHLKHLQSQKTRWHIDYFHRHAQPRAWCFLLGAPRTGAPLECRWSQAVWKTPSASVPMQGFGASDCRYACPAHFFAICDEIAGEAPLLSQTAWLTVLAEAASVSLYRLGVGFPTNL
ncbi:MAG: GIY-YIG nuclease family protein [Anaerolineales bacterium]|nr:GIY-YIG nuclease family protein [Anaerolineales bacterium]